MAKHIWFWQGIVSPHMVGLAAALSSQGADVTYVAQECLSVSRTKQGWQIPKLGKVNLRLASTKDDVMQLVAKAPANSIHICQGIRSNGLIGYAQRGLAQRSLNQWVIMESVDDTGWIGGIKRLEYCRLYYRWRQRTEGILAIGHATHSWIVARGVARAKVFPFAYFLQDVTPPSPREVCAATPFQILFVGRIIARKQLGSLIEAISVLKDEWVELTIIGAGPQEKKLRGTAKQLLGERVKWLGRKPQTAVHKHMIEADCLVLPSRYDGWGAVVSEALMVGTPVICSDHCGAANVVRASGVGGVFPAGNHSALTALLREMIAHRRLSPKSKKELADWARCLGGQAGATYLTSILRYADGSATRPRPPWEDAGS